jgi:hypothetical protein
MNGINGGVNNSLGSQGNNPTGSNSYRILQKLIGVIYVVYLFLERKFFLLFLKYHLQKTDW